ncbi:PucR family transcriptional regulator [Streptomyces sp. NPDC054786]
MRDNAVPSAESVREPAGLDGLRRTHLCAREAARVAWQSGRSDLCDYRQVRLAALMTANTEQAGWFVHDILGPLATDDSRTADLRQTLRHYLASGRSLLHTGEQLHIARNTVAYRVKSAEARLGRTVGTDDLETRVALDVFDHLGDGRPGPAGLGDRRAGNSTPPEVTGKAREAPND